MSSSIFRSPRARLVALAVGVAVVGPLAMAAPSLAAAGTPTAGTNCVASDGKLTGRGSTLQTWLQDDLIGQFASDVCGPVAAEGITTSGGVTYNNPTLDPTDPGTTASPNQAVWLPAFPATTFTPCTPSTLATCSTADQSIGDWLVAYNDQLDQQNGYTGSGYGETAIWCRTDAFSGTDIPVTSQQLPEINNDLPAQGTGNQALGKPCDPAALVEPFTPSAGTGGYPNLGDVLPANSNNTNSNGVMMFPIGGSAVGLAVNLKGTVCAPTGTLDLSTTAIADIYSGSTLTWNAVAGIAGVSGFPAGCASGAAVPIVRVVRADNSGTVQSFLNYLNDANPGESNTACGGTDTGSFAQMQGFQAAALGNSDVNWPNGPQNGVVPAGDKLSTGGFLFPATATCSAVEDQQAAISGGPALISQLEATTGGIGFADYADLKHDPANLAGLTIADVQQYNATTYAAPNTGTGASDCNFASASLPTGGINGSVQLNGTDWELNEPSVAATPDNVSWSHQPGAYPICSLTWDFVWSGVDGNNNQPTTTSTGGALPIANLNIAADSELPNKGNFTVPVTNPDVTATNPVTLPGTGIVPVSFAGFSTAQPGTFTAPVIPTTTVNNTGGYTASTTSIVVASTAGLPATGTVDFTVSVNGGAGTDTLSYNTFTGNTLNNVAIVTGSGTDTIANGATLTFPTQNETLTFTGTSGCNAGSGTDPCYSGTSGGTSLTGVTAPTAGSIASGASLTFPTQSVTLTYNGLAANAVTLVSEPASGTIANGATLTFPNGSGGPEPGLTADQRRALYSYFTYVFSPAAQESEPAAGYASLPTDWLDTIREGFQANF